MRCGLITNQDVKQPRMFHGYGCQRGIFMVKQSNCLISLQDKVLLLGSASTGI